jgi:hypothetical protein
MKTITVTQTEAKDILASIPHTAFFGCTFTKADGKLRKINCNKSISVGLKTKRQPVTDLKDTLTIYDINCSGYRKVNLNTLTEIRTNNTKYIVL